MAHEEEDIKTLREVFSLYDRDGSGAVDTKELGAILEAIGKDPADGGSPLRPFLLSSLLSLACVSYPCCCSGRNAEGC